MNQNLQWAFVPLNKFEVPIEPAAVAVQRNLLKSLKKPFDRSTPVEVKPDVPEDKNRMVSQRLMNWLVPEPSWHETCYDEVQGILGSWLSNDTAQNHHVFVATPYNGVQEMIEGWAKANALPMLDPPNPEQILIDDDDWIRYLEASFKQMDDSADDKALHLVIPHLERYYLRHHHGLDLIRRLLDCLASGNYSVVLVCDSWAWAYLDCVMQISSRFQEPNVLDAVKTDHLVCWFGQLSSNVGNRSVTFRKSNNSGIVIPPMNGRHINVQEEVSPPGIRFMNRIAAYSRGDPGIAWSLWRQNLRLSADEDIDEKVQEKAATDDGVTIWVRPQQRLDEVLPEVPARRTPTEEALLLHTILLHNGLTSDRIAMLLSQTSAQIQNNLYKLQTKRLLKLTDDGRWHVAPLAYRVVYDLLKRIDFVVSEI